MIAPSGRCRTGWKAGRSCFWPMTPFSPAKSSSFSLVCRCVTILTASWSVRTTWRDGRTRGLSAATRLEARIVHEVDRRALERLAQPPRRRSRAGAPPPPRGSPAAGRGRGRQVVEDEEAVGAGEADRVDERSEARRADVVLEDLRDRGEHPVVVLPAEELLEAEELADLQVDDAEVLDPLVDALGARRRGGSAAASRRRRRCGRAAAPRGSRARRRRRRGVEHRLGAPGCGVSPSSFLHRVEVRWTSASHLAAQVLGAEGLGEEVGAAELHGRDAVLDLRAARSGRAPGSRASPTGGAGSRRTPSRSCPAC